MYMSVNVYDAQMCTLEKLWVLAASSADNLLHECGADDYLEFCELPAERVGSPAILCPYGVPHPL